MTEWDRMSETNGLWVVFLLPAARCLLPLSDDGAAQ